MPVVPQPLSRPEPHLEEVREWDNESEGMTEAQAEAIADAWADNAT